MFKLLVSILVSKIIPIDISFSCNGSRITFSKEGDIIIKAGRSIIENGKYHFTNCTPLQIQDILYRENFECFQQLEEEI